MRVDKPCKNSTCQEKSESVSENTYLVIRQKAKVKVFSNKPEEDKFYQSEHKQGYNISCSVEAMRSIGPPPAYTSDPALAMTHVRWRKEY